MKRILPVFFMLLAVFACERNQSVFQYDIVDDQIGKGNLKVLLNVANMPDEVDAVSGVMTRDGMDQITFDLDIGNEYASAIVEDIAVGVWNLVVRAFNADGIIIYSGATDLEIIGGLENAVNLGLSSTGDLLISVTWEEEDEEDLFPDRFEENDVMSQATSISEYNYYENLTITEDDDDWYSIYLSADSIALKCFFKHAEGDINLDIVDRNGVVLKSSTGTSDNEITYYIVDQLGEYFIRIYLESGGSNTYTIWWDDIWVWDTGYKKGLRNNGEGVE